MEHGAPCRGYGWQPMAGLAVGFLEMSGPPQFIPAVLLSSRPHHLRVNRRLARFPARERRSGSSTRQKFLTGALTGHLQSFNLIPNEGMSSYQHLGDAGDVPVSGHRGWSIWRCKAVGGLEGTSTQSSLRRGRAGGLCAVQRIARCSGRANSPPGLRGAWSSE
jgi:hypothetical protein